MRWLLFFMIGLWGNVQAQKATLSGLVLNEQNQPLPLATITVSSPRQQILSDSTGRFTCSVQAGKDLILQCSYSGYNTYTKKIWLSPGEIQNLSIQLTLSGKTLGEVTVTNERDRQEPSLIRINPKTALLAPTPTGGIEGLIKTLVGSNNELSSQFSVRGGNYDENLMYINDFEIFRPYLVSSGQQEGLSLINPALVKSVNFYTGGFQARYGDKMSSVLDIQYRKPTVFSGSAYISLLEQGLHLEGSAAAGKFTWLVGARNRSNQSLLSSQPVQGAYIPAASDIQALLTYKISSKWQAELLAIRSVSRFRFQPESVKKTSTVFSPFYAASIGIDVYFEGRERDRYASSLGGLTLVHTPASNLTLKWQMSYFRNDETENYDIGGAYLFGERDTGPGSSGEIINPLGAGFYRQYARNRLEINNLNIAHRGIYNKGKHAWQWGIAAERSGIDDLLRQFEYQDSAGYSLPNQPPSLQIFQSVYGKSSLNIMRYSAYLQDNLVLQSGKANWILTGGMRVQYNDLNREWLISPRIQLSCNPGWVRDVIFRAALGAYHQPPFYRELRNPDGSLNTGILAQKSYQLVTGMDYRFTGPGIRPFRFTAEAYYKQMRDVVPYDVDNVKIRYLGTNDAKAYAAGLDLRLAGELVPDAESWISVGIMQTKENLENDFYTEYKNAAGEIIGPDTDDQQIADSSRQEVGWLRRPTDRRLNVGIYLEDYLPSNKNFKVHLSLLYGTNLPYNIPNSTRYRNALIIEPYIRADIGFSALLLGPQTVRRSHSPFRSLNSIWVSLEVFNLINRANTISYQLVKDFSNNIFAMPNRLTPRLINLKLLARF